jgi:hypothetical protein
MTRTFNYTHDFPKVRQGPNSLGTKNPSQSRCLIVVGIAAGQQYRAVVQPCFGHEVAGIIHLPGSDKEFPVALVEPFPASSRNQQFSNPNRHGLHRQLEARVVHRGCWRKLAGLGIVDLCAVQVSAPIALIASRRLRARGRPEVNPRCAGSGL